MILRSGNEAERSELAHCTECNEEVRVVAHGLIPPCAACGCEELWSDEPRVAREDAS
jgi:predicted RNA-binding Zn-ribbon protein involved in translation (DUF1610 family)